MGLTAVSFGVDGVRAQEEAQAAVPRMFEAQFRAADSNTLVAGQTTVELWGIQSIESMPTQFNVSARNVLDNALGADKAQCTLKKRMTGLISAQCMNAANLDLGLYMLQQGYATVDRAAVYGSPSERAYIQAEMEAQEQGLGVWSGSDANKSGNNGFLLTLGVILLLCLLVAFTVLTITIMRGFQKVTAAQSANTDLMEREQLLRAKERQVFATMLDSEIKANKSKIEAYLVVYDEMLKDLNNIDKTPKYKAAGDIVQVQPALDRSVFDRNTDKLDILGDTLSSQVVHLYARIKTNPDYINLEPDTDVDKALEIVQGAYDGAERLNQISDRLIDLFEQGGYSSDEY